MKALVLCAHPDDEVLGCGGWLAKLTDEGADVSVIFTTDGIRHPPIQTDSRDDSYAALEVLGVARDNVHYLGLPTQRSDGAVLRDYTDQVVERAGEPDLVITTSMVDLNLDHHFAHRLATVCFRSVKRQIKIVEMEILSSTEYGEQPFHPNFYVDVTDQMDRKIEALSCYSKQVLSFPHPRSPEALTIKAQQRGLEVGYQRAEAFHIIRWFE